MTANNGKSLSSAHRSQEELSAYVETLRAGPGRIRFADAIRAISGCEVTPFVPSCAEDAELIQLLSRAAEAATKAAYEKGIYRSRPNEVGNDMEGFVKEALQSLGLGAATPMTQAGGRSAMGYPDIEVTQHPGRCTYLEVKTYNPDTARSSQRTFYFSPPPSQDTCKVCHDAHHVVIAFEIGRETRDGRDAFVPLRWSLWDVTDMPVQIKYEFNASNPDIYRDEALLARGD